MLSALAQAVKISSNKQYKQLVDLFVDSVAENYSSKNNTRIEDICPESYPSIKILKKSVGLTCDSIDEFKDELESIIGEKNYIIKSVIDRFVKLDSLVRSEVEKLDIKIEYSTMSSVYSNFNFHSGLVFSILNASF